MGKARLARTLAALPGTHAWGLRRLGSTACLQSTVSLVFNLSSFVTNTSLFLLPTCRKRQLSSARSSTPCDRGKFNHFLSSLTKARSRQLGRHRSLPPLQRRRQSRLLLLHCCPSHPQHSSTPLSPQHLGALNRPYARRSGRSSRRRSPVHRRGGMLGHGRRRRLCPPSARLTEAACLSSSALGQWPPLEALRTTSSS